MLTVTLYTRANCKLCEEAEEDLKALQDVIPHKLAIVDIDSDSTIRDTYGMEIPVVEVGPFKLKAPFTRQQLRMTLGAAADRREQLEKINDKAYQINTSGVEKITRSDRFSYWLSKHYLAIFSMIIILYAGIPFLAPVFKKAGWNAPAEVIYKIYSPLCHQWGFRSFYLFGEQAAYPHAAANMKGVLTFEEVTGISDQNDPSRTQARLFEGNPTVGYKIAFCERDTAIWGSMALFAIIFGLSKRRLPKINWLIWLLVGLGPIGLDGFSQLFSQLGLPFLKAILPYRESTPFLRVLTGCLFGFFTAWFMFPLIEETMADTRKMFSKKFAALQPKADHVI
jgi:uncharacterized membrane protein